MTPEIFPPHSQPILLRVLCRLLTGFPFPSTRHCVWHRIRTKSNVRLTFPLVIRRTEYLPFERP